MILLLTYSHSLLADKASNIIILFVCMSLCMFVCLFVYSFITQEQVHLSPPGFHGSSRVPQGCFRCQKLGEAALGG